jgi:hypothetical protein
MNFCEINNFPINQKQNTYSNKVDSSQKLPILPNRRNIEKMSQFNYNNFPLTYKSQMYSYNNYDNIESTINKYSLRLLEKLNINRALKPVDLNSYLLLNRQRNMGIDISPKNLIKKNFKDVMGIKPISMPKNRNKEKQKSFTNKIKVQKQMSIQNNSNGKNNNNDLSSSFTNYENYRHNLNDNNFREFSGNQTNKKKELDNIGISRNFSNSNNNYQIEKEKKTNESIKNESGQNIENSQNIKKHPIGLKKYDLFDDNVDFKMNSMRNSNSNDNSKNIKAISPIINMKKNNINNYKIKAEKKFSIIDIPLRISNNDKILDVFKNNKNLSNKEKACYILANSPILPMSSQIIFSRSSENIKKLTSTKNILKNYESYLNKKIKDYEDKINLYNKQITSVFTTTKIAEITLNFITKENEVEFNDIYNNLIHNNNKSDYFYIYYKSYIKIIYYIINESFEEVNSDGVISEIGENKLLINLYTILNKKGYKNIKDYLYFLYISNKNKEKVNYFMQNIDKINNIINNDAPKLLNFYESFKMCKFIQFSYFLIKEIIEFGNNTKNIIKLELETKDFVEQLKNNLVKFKSKFSFN